MSEIESAWSRYPGYRIDLIPVDGVGRAIAAGFELAASTRCLIVRESEHRDVLYFPIDDITVPYARSAHHTVCPFKGEASYGSVSMGLAVLEDVFWWYPEPMAEVAGLAGYASFYADRVDVSVSVPFPDGGAATTHLPVWGTAQELAGLMDVASDGEGRFVAPPHPDPRLGTFFAMGWHAERRNVVEGGQLLGGAIVAAARSRPDQRVTSAHITFLKIASFDEPIHYAVDAARRGGTLSTFDVSVEQAGALRARALVMTDIGTADLVRHAVAMPDVPPPDRCPTLDFHVVGRELRVVDGAYRLEDSPAGSPELFVWSRFVDAPDDEAVRQALLAQATTHYSINAALRPHEGVAEADAHRTISTGPISATIAFHDEVDVTRWLLTETRAIWAGRGSTQSQVRVFTEDGRLVASKTVQSIVRAFSTPPEQLGQGYSTAM
jgi:acyl-CoA thioesterase-2